MFIVAFKNKVESYNHRKGAYEEIDGYVALASEGRRPAQRVCKTRIDLAHQFKNREHAQRYADQFGGEVVDLDTEEKITLYRVAFTQVLEITRYKRFAYRDHRDVFFERKNAFRHLRQDAQKLQKEIATAEEELNNLKRRHAEMLAGLAEETKQP